MKKNNKKYISIDGKFSTNGIISSNLVPVKITLLHDSLNRNHSNIELKTIKENKDSIKNKPILAHIRHLSDGVDFGGHDMEIVETKDGIKERYIEQPIGVIPESTEISFSTKDGKTYMSVTGYIYENYSNEALSLIEETNGKCVSVELNVLEGDFTDEGVFDIFSFDYLGVTVLSDKITPGMDENCRIELFSKVDYTDFIKQANEDVLKFEQEHKGENPDKEENIPNEGKNEEEPIEEPQEEEIEIEEPTFDENPNGEDTVDKPVEENIEFNLDIFKDLFPNKEIDCLETLKSLFSECLKSMEKEIEELRAFKTEIEVKERKTQVEEMLSKFNFDEEAVKELRERALCSEITLDELETHLYALLGKMAMNTNKNEKPDSVKLSFNENIEKKPDYPEIINKVLGF